MVAETGGCHQSANLFSDDDEAGKQLLHSGRLRMRCLRVGGVQEEYVVRANEI